MDRDIIDRKAKAIALSRRGFGFVAAAAAISSSGPGWAKGLVLESDVEIKTPDGVADAALFHPASGRWPAVLIWTDALGLRPAFRDMARRLAAEGYVVLLPNPFYRSQRAPIFGASFDWSPNSNDRARAFTLANTLTPQTTARDAEAFVRFLDNQTQTNTALRAGVHGYCMGGALVFRTAAWQANRIGAAATFHGGDLVTSAPDSPHLLIPKMKAKVCCAIATNDDQKQPDAKVVLRTTFAAARLKSSIEVYPDCNHGWCVKDNATYQDAGAERAYLELLSLYKERLV